MGFKTWAAGAVAAVSLAGPAAMAHPVEHSEARPLQMQVQRDQGFQDVIGVETRRPAAAVIATDAVYGGLAGLAIGAGVALIDGGNNWGRNLAVGAGVGLLAGGVLGAVDAAASADKASPVVDSFQNQAGSAALGGPELKAGGRF